jgi:hypothetical protein
LEFLSTYLSMSVFNTNMWSGTYFFNSKLGVKQGDYLSSNLYK